MVRKLIKDFQSASDAHTARTGESDGYLYAHWPVQNGMGSPTLDCIMCYYGRYIGVETKAPGKKPTPRQEATMQQMRDAGGITMVIENAADVENLRGALKLIKWTYANDSSQ